jgi:lysine N6-hydroxylase
MSAPPETLDVVGVGIGPANLSLAALLHGNDRVTKTFVDRKKAFEWHAGIMLPDAHMQVHFLKDLVTPVDPTSPFSFLAFAVESRRLYRLLITGRSRVPRKEFEQYCRWVADRVEDLRFGVAVTNVEWDGSAFLVHTDDRPIRARNIVTGTGLVPLLPECAKGHDPEKVFHASRLLDVPRDLSRRRVAVIGGGQSGAEVVHYLLGSEARRPARVVWGSRRSNLFPLDDSPFVEEHYLPNYSRHFHGQPAAYRDWLNEQQRMSSDGVSVDLLRAVYRRLYDLELLEGVEHPCEVMVGHQLLDIEKTRGGLLTTWRSGSGDVVRRQVDVVICATGYRHGLPAVLSGMRHRLPRSDDFEVRADFSLDWDGPPDNRVYVQNAARRHFGVADPNLSLLAWRSAVIVNSLLGWQRYDTEAVSGAVTWSFADERRPAGALGT